MLCYVIHCAQWRKSCIGYTKIVAASLDTDMKGKTICGIPIVANHDGIVDYACDEWVDEVLIPPCSEDEYPEKMADIFLEMGIAGAYRHNQKRNSLGWL